MHFLKGFTDTSLKNNLKYHFDESINLAKLYHLNFVNIVEVRVSKSCWWDPSGIIGLNPQSETSTLYHEVFHSAFHCSELHTVSNEEWGDAFCDAFRYFTEIELSSEGEWHQKLASYTSMDFDEIMKISNDAGHDKKYAFPASLIIKKVCDSGTDLLTLWEDFIDRCKARRAFLLNEEFSYSMENGKPL